ncbi:hypothetical protein B0H13DRAFT_1897281 [Mycena leptocephala]|nr:hypothetical protein B0H13DRAFT_1897281 [Mycena leptocephala]
MAHVWRDCGFFKFCKMKESRGKRENSDNPMQSEVSGHIGGKGNRHCRKCEVGGTQKEKSTNEGYHALFEAGSPRMKEKIITELEKQVKLACSGVVKPIKDLQTQTGFDSSTVPWQHSAAFLSNPRCHIIALELRERVVAAAQPDYLLATTTTLRTRVYCAGARSVAVKMPDRCSSHPNAAGYLTAKAKSRTPWHLEAEPTRCARAQTRTTSGTRRDSAHSLPSRFPLVERRASRDASVLVNDTHVSPPPLPRPSDLLGIYHQQSHLNTACDANSAPANLRCMQDNGR